MGIYNHGCEIQHNYTSHLNSFHGTNKVLGNLFDHIFPKPKNPLVVDRSRRYLNKSSVQGYKRLTLPKLNSITRCEAQITSIRSRLHNLSELKPLERLDDKDKEDSSIMGFEKMTKMLKVPKKRRRKKQPQCVVERIDTKIDSESSSILESIMNPRTTILNKESPTRQRSIDEILNRLPQLKRYQRVKVDNYWQKRFLGAGAISGEQISPSRANLFDNIIIEDPRGFARREDDLIKGLSRDMRTFGQLRKKEQRKGHELWNYSVQRHNQVMKIMRHSGSSYDYGNINSMPYS